MLIKISARHWRWILVLALAAYVIKNIFVGVDNDETYGIVLGYRLAMGDRLLLEMWEPHQTSAIFTALLIKPFLWLGGGSVTFLNLYLRVVYFVIHGLVSYSVYCTFRLWGAGENDSEHKGECAKWLGLIYFVSIPKCICIPEYSNLHIWFFTLFCLSFVWFYFERSPVQGKWPILLLGGIFLTADVLAYPSMVLLYPFGLLLIWWKDKEQRGEGIRSKERYSNNHFWTKALLFTLPCVIGAIVLGGYVFSYMTWEQIGEVLPYILGDGSHDVSAAEKWSKVLISVGEMAGFLAAGAVAAGVCTLVSGTWYQRTGKGKLNRREWLDLFGAVMFGILILQQFYCWFTSEFNASYPHIIYLYLCLLGIYYSGKTAGKQRMGLYLIGLSAVSYISIILMSNWEPIHLIPYLIVGVLGGLFYWYRYLEEQYRIGRKLFGMICGLLVFSNIFGYCYLIIGGAQVHSTIFDVGGYSREGLRKGIIAEYMSAYRYNTNYKSWAEAIPEGSNVLFVGTDPAFYMLGDCVIASGSTISTPTFDESLLAYWEMNPDRYPDAVVFDCMWGSIEIVEEDSFIMQWVKEEFGYTEMLEYPYVTVYRR